MIFQSGSFSVVAVGDGLGSVNFEVTGATVPLTLVQAQEAVQAIALGLVTGLLDGVINTSSTIYLQGCDPINPTGFSWNGVKLTTPGWNIIILVSGTPVITYLTSAQAQQLVNALGLYCSTYI
ncbi:MAG: hypothetical protein WCC37_25175 [Candidatus Sulfotelmatobacter sp.]|jgi:hypothetical protein